MWAEATAISCNMGNICVTTANEGGMPPFGKWRGKISAPGGIQPFDTVGYMRTTTRPHKLKPHGVMCTMVGLAHDHLNGTFRERQMMIDEEP